MSGYKEIDSIPEPDSKDFRLLEITRVNHKPHPYMIGPRLVGYVSDNCNGMLGVSAIEEAEKTGIHCAHPKCRLSHSEHTSDKVLFIKALVDKELNKLDGLNEYLSTIGDALKKINVDGVAFVSCK